MGHQHSLLLREAGGYLVEVPDPGDCCIFGKRSLHTSHTLERDVADVLALYYWK